MLISVIFCDAEILNGNVNSTPIFYALRRSDIKYMAGQCQFPAALTRVRDTVPILQEAGWATGPTRKNVVSSAQTGFDAEPIYGVAHNY